MIPNRTVRSSSLRRSIAPVNGTAELQTDGLSILYTPETDYVGSDSFTYTIEDETGLTATADVEVITVTPENQAPEASYSDQYQRGPRIACLCSLQAVVLLTRIPGPCNTSGISGTEQGLSTNLDTSYTFGSAGIYSVSLTLTDDEGLSDVATTTITVSAPPNTAPNAVASATPTATIRYNSHLTAANLPTRKVR